MTIFNKFMKDDLYPNYNDIVYCINCGQRTGDRFNCSSCKKVYFCGDCTGFVCMCRSTTKEFRCLIERMNYMVIMCGAKQLKEDILSRGHVYD